MKAITRLRKSGMTTAQIAEAIADKSGGHLVRAYDKHARFPSRRTFERLVALADSRGVVLFAQDFIAPAADFEQDAATVATIRESIADNERKEAERSLRWINKCLAMLNEGEGNGR